MNKAYAAVGKALIAAQVLETTLVPIGELYKTHADPGRLERTKGRIPAGEFKLPIPNLVKFLRDRGSIAEDLEDRLLAYVEDRNLLVHRWIRENPLPDDQEPETMLLLMNHALKVEREATDLARMFVGYVIKYADPDGGTADPDEYRSRMATFFLRVHE